MTIQEGNKIVQTRNWSELVKPEQMVRDAKSSEVYGRFACEPLERGFGTTLGNALRRVLLSSLQGGAIVSIKIQGIQHEYTTIPGVLEDITDIVLNLKQVRFSINTEQPQKLILQAGEKGAVTASAIQETQNVSVLNKDQIIATLTEDVDLTMELEVRMGKGYVPAEMTEKGSDEIGLIYLDASFSPVKKVAYAIEPARVGQMTNYDKLILEVWTDGSVTPEDAVAYSAKILKEQLSVFINFDEQVAGEEQTVPAGGEDLNPNLFKDVEELELSVRATNCLRSANIATVGELVLRTEGDMLKTKNFGRKSLDEIRQILADMDLEFGMVIDNFKEHYEEWLKRKDSDEA